jgi:hypothetical protein
MDGRAIVLRAFQDALAELHEMPEDFAFEDAVSYAQAKLTKLSPIQPCIAAAPVELRPSPVHGMGVFATRDIAKGEIVTTYPRDCVIWSMTARDGGMMDWCLVAGRGEPPSEHRQRYYSMYLKIYNGIARLVGDPSRTERPEVLGHMINDRVKLPLDVATMDDNETIRVTDLKALLAVETYERISKAHANVKKLENPARETREFACSPGSDHNLYLVSTRAIKKDEELFTHYGVRFWLNRVPRR